MKSTHECVILYSVPQKEKKMKSIKLCSLLLCVLLLLPLLSSCVWERHDLLFEIEQDGLTYCARGNGERVKQIVVKENGEAIWSKSVQTDRKMGKVDDAYGLLVQDLNFDGYDDILIATEKAGDCISYACYVRVGSKPEYKLHKELSAFYNVRANERLEAIFTFEQTTEARGNDAYITCDKTVKYLWQDGKLVPDMYAAIYYYSDGGQTPYRYSVAYYDEELGKFDESSDKMLTQEEYENADWSFLYYFK